MKDGYIKVAAASVNVAVADVEHNQRQITARMQEADALGINLLVLPELCLTGYSSGSTKRLMPRASASCMRAVICR